MTCFLCDKKSVAKSLCMTHYMRRKRADSIELREKEVLYSAAWKKANRYKYHLQQKRVYEKRKLLKLSLNQKESES